MPSWTTADEIKAMLRIPAAITQHDAILGTIASQVSAEINAQLDLPCSATTTMVSCAETLDVDDWGIDRIRLRYAPIISIAALTDDGSAVARADYGWEAEIGYIFLKGDGAQFTPGKQTVAVAYTAGFAVPATDAPDLCGAAALMGIERFNRAPMTGHESESVGGLSYRATRNPDTIIEETLGRYRPVLRRTR